MKQLLCVILGLVLLSGVSKNQPILSQVNSSQKEVLYFPKSLSFFNFGYNKVISHIFWFKTLNYFGRHYKSDKNYEWLGAMCQVVTDLNPKAYESFEFCSLMLAWEANEPQKAIDILTTAIKANPDVWRFYYLRGSFEALFTNNLRNARDDFFEAAKCSEAPSFLWTLSEKISYGVTPKAYKFLERAIKEAKTQQEKDVLLNRYNELKGKR